MMSDPLRLQYRLLTDVEKETMQRVKAKAYELYMILEVLKGNTKNPAELIIAQRKVQECVFWATHHITGDPT
jgi:hypothetical protein